MKKRTQPRENSENFRVGGMLYRIFYKGFLVVKPYQIKAAPPHHNKIYTVLALITNLVHTLGRERRNMIILWYGDSNKYNSKQTRAYWEEKLQEEVRSVYLKVLC